MTTSVPLDRDPHGNAVANVFKEVLKKYANEAVLLTQNERNTLFVDFKDVEMHDNNLADDIICEYSRFYPFLCRALIAFVREEKLRRAEAEMDPNADAAARMLAQEQVKQELDNPSVRNKDYFIGFYNYAERDNIRDLSSTKVGCLTRVAGQVVRAHPVHPELILGCFKCKDCLAEQYCEQQFKYTEPIKCSNDNCNNRLAFELIADKSRFTDFQRLRIQETQQELPQGALPRCYDVIIRGGDLVESILPGDRCDFIGTPIAAPNIGQLMSGIVGTTTCELGADSGVTGLRALGVREMCHTLAFMANACVIDGQSKPCTNYDQKHRDMAQDSTLHADDFSKEEMVKIHRMSEDKHLLNHLSESLFSSIFGSDDIKRGIILQLLGGCPKQTNTGTKLRGDINICLVGDPSTAKSQFLKIVTDFAPVKAVFTSGKASSASGLTAAVLRDTDGSFVIEAGALLLADRGICCIDEFDKMDLKDQVAIHEAMEQQTISITKAGVSATLNARASILAAANPIGGLYNPEKSLRQNLSFSLPIMSRFDLFFVIQDPCDRENDEKIAQRILDLHRTYANSKNPTKDMYYSFEDIRLYIRFARKYYPKMPLGVEDVFTAEYLKLRANSKDTRTSLRITVRQLESLVRLSEAIARANCSEYIKPEYVREASRLIEKTLCYVGRVNLDLGAEKEEKPAEEDQQSQGMYEGELESQPLQPTQQTQEKVTITLSEYKNMAEVFLIKLRQRDEAVKQGTESAMMKRSELIDWYLHQCIGEISTEAELIKKKLVCDRVLDRLIRTDFILMEVKEGKILDPTSDQAGQHEAEDLTIIMNPTVEIEDFFDLINC